MKESPIYNVILDMFDSFANSKRRSKMNVYLISLVLVIMFNESKQDIPRQKLRACQRQTQATQNDINIVKRKEIPSSPTGKCYLACVFEASRLLRDGRYNEAGAYAVAQRAYRRTPSKVPVAKRILNTCKTQVSKIEDKCQLAVRLAVCTTQMSQRFKLQNI